MSRHIERLGRAGNTPPPVHHVHLGLGNFFRAHQAAYTHAAADGGAWGIAAFSGRSRELADAMAGQGGMYTLITRGPGGDSFQQIASVAEAYPGDEHERWLHYLGSRDVGVVTLTVTEAAYLRDSAGWLDFSEKRVKHDAEVLRQDRHGEMWTVPGRLVAGLLARRESGAGPVSVLPCDNLPDNGTAAARVVTAMAEAVDPDAASWIEETVSFGTSMVDRITPRATDRDRETVLENTGVADACPVVTEPFTEWVLRGDFPAGRPRWEDGGALFVDDVTPYERRKLWLLNGAHSLLAYAGSLRGHVTVADAACDHICAAWVAELWEVASRYLPWAEAELLPYREALLDRFRNPAIRHRLDQVAADGSQKLPVRILPVLAEERSVGRVPLGATRVLAAWLLHLRGFGAPVTDVRAGELTRLAQGRLKDAVRRVLDELDPDVGADSAVTTTVQAQAEELTRA